jgi:hypothetical protein
MADCILRGAPVREDVERLRGRFLEMRYCFTGPEADELLEQLHAII